MPSVRGRERIRTIAVFTLAAVTAATLVGFLSGAALGWVPDPSDTLSGAVLATTVGGDLVHRRTGRLRPIRVNGQVPRQWGTLFSPPVVGLLYGARLGVGPLTLLPTWLWWAATGLAAVTNPGAAAAVGATFGLVRAISIIGISLVGERRPLQHRWFARLPAHDPYRLVVAASSIAAMLLLTACGGQSATPVSSSQFPNPTSPVGPTTSPNPAGPTITSTPKADTQAPTTRGGSMLNPEPPAQTLTSRPGPAPTSPRLAPGALAVTMLAQVPGFAPIDEAGADAAIDLDQASQRQPDPAAERALLETRGFRGGWTRAFRNDTQDVVLVTAYEFASPQQADLYLQDGLITVGGYGGELFEIAQLPGAHGFRQTSGDASGPLVTHGLTFTDGNRWYLLFVLGDPQTATVDIVVDATREQMAALEG